MYVLGLKVLVPLLVCAAAVYSESLLSHIFSTTAASEGLGNPVARGS